MGERSRGAIVVAYLGTPAASPETTARAAARLIADGVADIGGFSLLFGRVRRRRRCGVGGDGGDADDTGLAVVSNRSTDLGSVHWLLSKGEAEEQEGGGETHALSNSFFGDRTWGKVVDAESAVAASMKELVAENAGPDEIVDACLRILSTNSLPKQHPDETWDDFVRKVRHSIFVPVVDFGGKTQTTENSTPQFGTPRSPSPLGNRGAKSATVTNGVVNGNHDANATNGAYGTQKQSVILVDNDGKVRFFERTLFDMEGKPVKLGEGDRTFEFQIEGW